MKALLAPLPLVSLLAVSWAGAQDTTTRVTPAPMILTADKSKPPPKTSPQPPQMYRVVPQPQVKAPVRLLDAPRFPMPVIQHDLTQYPMPVSAGNGRPVRLPVAPPKPPFER
jgi:hypothetical protein